MALEFTIQDVLNEMAKEGESLYRCPHCNALVTRENTKAWIKSYCDEMDRYTRLIKVKADAPTSRR